VKPLIPYDHTKLTRMVTYYSDSDCSYYFGFSDNQEEVKVINFQFTEEKKLKNVIIQHLTDDSDQEIYIHVISTKKLKHYIPYFYELASNHKLRFLTNGLSPSDFSV
jgi:hypothetical protein